MIFEEKGVGLVAAIGYAVLPVTVSIKGITGQLNKELAQPAQAAAKRASGNINKSLKAGVEDAAKAVENARKREEYATKAVVDAEKALQNARDTSEQKAKAVESAELKLKSARSGAQSKVADAEAKLSRLRESGKASAEQIESAERNLEQVRATQGSKVIDAENNLAKARTGARSAADSLAGAEEKVASKKTQAANASEDVISATRRMDAAQQSSAASSGRFAQAMDRVKDSASKTGSAVAATAEKYRMHAGVVVGAVGVLAKGAMDYAAEAEQSYGAVEAVFAEHAQGIIDHSKDAAEAVGVSGHEYRELSAYMGAMLKNLGMPMDEISGKTQDLVGVGADLAATFGGTTKDAVEAIGAVMRGETDPIERYGVSIKEADIKAKAAAMGLGDLEGAAGKQAKAQAILALLTEQTASAQGQFGRETDTAAHKQQVATAKLNDAKEAIGTGLLPVYAAFMDKLAGVSRLIGEHPKLFIVLGGAIAGLAGAVLTLGTVAPIFTTISLAAGAAGMSMWGYVAAQVAAVAPIAGIVAVVAAAGVALWAFFTKTETGKRIWDSLVDAFKTGVDWIKGVFVAAWDGLVDAMRPVVDFFGRVGDAAEGVWDIFSRGDFTGGIFGLQEDSAFVDFLFDIRENVLKVWDAIKAAPSHIWDGMKKAWEAISAVMQKVADIAGGALKNAFSSLWDALKSLGGTLVEVGKALGGALLDAAKGLWDAFTGLWDGAKKLWDVLAPLLLPILKTIGIVVGGLVVGAFLAVVKAIEFAAQIIEVVAKAFSWLIEHAIVPLIGWIGELIGWMGEKLGGVFSWVGDAAKWLADALVWTWEKIKEGWNWLSDAISVAWETVIKPVFNFFAEAAKVLFAVVATVLIAPFIIAWNLLSAAVKAGWEYVVKPAWDALQAAAQWMWANVLMPVFGWIKQGWDFLIVGIKWAWENVLKPAWDALQVAAQWMWTNVLMPIWGGIKAGWDFLVNSIKWAWENILKPAWDALQVAAQWMWNSVLMPVFNFIKAGWDVLVNAIKWAWENILKPTWDALGNALRWLNDTVIQPILQWIQDRWRQMADGIKWVRDNVIQPVFDALGRGLDTLKGWFETAVDAIGRTWNRVKELTAKPIKFVVDTVFNNGIRKAWNAVVGFIGMDDKKMNEVELGELGKYASGGVLPGYTPGRDVHNFVSPTGGRLALSGGEAIMRPEWTRAVGGPAAVEQMNRAARTGKMKVPDAKQLKENDKIAQAHAMGGVFQAFANGGVVGAMERIIGMKYPMLVPVFSGYRPSADNHGRGLAGDFSNGTGNTPEMIALANDIANTYPGSMELIHEYPGFNRQIKNGQFVGGGGGSWGYYAGAGDHANHVHWAMDTPPTIPFGGGVFKGGSSGGGGGGFFDFVGQMVKPVWDKIIDAIPKYDKSKGWAAEVPGAFLKKGAGLVWDFVKEKASLFGGGGGGGNIDTSGVAGTNIQIGQELAKRAGWTGGEWEALKQLWHNESNWNHLAQNPTSTAYGIPQFLDSTWATVGYSKTSDPATQIAAGIKYIKQRPDYGVPSKALSLWQSRSPHWYDNGGYLKPGTTEVRNDTGKPEPVFTAEQWAVLRGNILTNAQAQNWHAVVSDLQVIAGGIQKAIGLVDWNKVGSEVSSEFGTKFQDGQMKDIQSVFGLPDYESIPLVKFQKEWADAVQKQKDDAATAAADASKTADSTTRTAAATEKIAGESTKAVTDGTTVSKPADVPSGAATATNVAGGVGSSVAGWIGAAAQMAGVPGGAAVGTAVGQGITIVTADMANAMQTFRKIQAQSASGMIGV